MVNELKRQSFHFGFGIILVLLLKYDILNLSLLFLILIIGFIISIISKNNKIPVISWFLDNFDRKEHLSGYGVLTYLLGIIFVFGLFNKEIALASIMILAFGDSFCHLGRFGRVQNPFNKYKFLEGTIIGIVAGTFGAVFFVPLNPAFFGSLVAMSIEGLELNVLKKKIDDNLYIPLISAVIISLF